MISPLLIFVSRCGSLFGEETPKRQQLRFENSCYAGACIITVIVCLANFGLEMEIDERHPPTKDNDVL